MKQNRRVVESTGIGSESYPLNLSEPNIIGTTHRNNRYLLFLWDNLTLTTIVSKDAQI
jgi:hypothetical protein